MKPFSTLWGGLSGMFGQSGGATPPPGYDFWYEPIGPGGSAVRITPDIAIKASALLACVKVICETVATLQLRVKYEDASGEHEATGHPLEEVLRYQFNVRQTAVEGWETMLFHACLEGAGYAEIVPGALGVVSELEPLTSGVRVERMSDRTLRVEFNDPVTNMRRRLLQDEVFRITGLSSNGATGLRIVDLAADAIGLGLAADNYAARNFDNKLNMGGFLVHPGQLSTEAQKNLVHALMKHYAGGRNVGRPMLLQEGMRFEQASMNASEAQLLEARKFQIGEIARYFRIPLHMLGVDDQTNRSTVEEQSLNFVRYTIRPWVKRIEQAIRRDLIIAKDRYFVKFNLESLMRGNAQARAEYFAKALGSGGHPGWMAPNEVRKVEGWNPLPGGDALPMQNGPNGASASEPAAMASAAERMVTKEHTAIRKALMRHAADFDSFRVWARAFYGGHVSTVMDALDIPKAAARAYCEHSRDALLTANDTESYLAAREDTAPAEIAGAIEKWKEAA